MLKIERMESRIEIRHKKPKGPKQDIKVQISQPRLEGVWENMNFNDNCIIEVL